MTTIKKEDHDAICRALVDRGRIIEAGFMGLRIAVIPANAPDVQVEEMRMAFFAGAQHLFGAIMGILEPGSEPTDLDLKRMSAIHAELNEFIEVYKKRHGIKAG
jgi:hypothetical protein